MSQSSKERDLSCSFKCNQEFLGCMNSGEDESVCPMKRAPCVCKCDGTD